MKKILLMLLLCLAIVACGKKEEVKEEVAQATEASQPADVGIPNPF